MRSSLLHLTPHSFSILPSHPSLDDTSTPRPPLREFLSSVFADAHHFLGSIPVTFQRNRKPCPSPPSSAPVQLSSRIIRDSRPDGNSWKEVWFCRKSTHADAPVVGSASWKEFQEGLKTNHAENEMDYTPSVTAVERLLEWPLEKEIEGGWRDVDMQVNVITHTFHPTILISPRSFISLSISAHLPEQLASGFVTVQIPLAHHQDAVPETLRAKITASTPRSSIFASYASVEQVVAGADRLEWTMATTSDADGAIPRWIQRSWTLGGIPKAIVADVGLFFAWTARRRMHRNSVEETCDGST